MSETYTQVRVFVASIAARNYDRVYVGITGATNPVVTSLFQTAMAYLSCHVIPVYVQARGAVRVQHVVASDVRDRVSAEDALATARSGQVRVAARLAERLPSDGQWKFLRSSLTALADWDDFDYSQARQTLEHQARKSGAFTQDSLLAYLADTVARLAAYACQMSDFAKKIRDQQDFDATATSAGWAQRVSETGTLLVADWRMLSAGSSRVDLRIPCCDPTAPRNARRRCGSLQLESILRDPMPAGRLSSDIVLPKRHVWVNWRSRPACCSLKPPDNSV